MLAGESTINKNKMKTGIELITEERARQMAPRPNPNRGNHTWPQTSGEGWTPEHDDTHENGELAAAGACYALIKWSETDAERLWPWRVRGTGHEIENGSPDGFKPSVDRIRNLVKAGALIAAEIDRLQRKVLAEPANIPSSATPQAGLEPRKRNGGEQ